MAIKKLILIAAFFLAVLNGFSQKILTLKEAVQTAITNFPSIKAKENYTNASKAAVEQAKKEALPNFVLSAQQDYGTVNGQNGPLYGFGGYGVASSGIPLPSQSWHAAFGALYLTNINWNVFTFGKVKERINAAAAFVARDEFDKEQELFQQQVKVAAAYLNLLAAQRITVSQQQNLSRADTFKISVTAKAKNGLIAGVDSSFANAEVSNAKTALIYAKDIEQERANQLAYLMGIPSQEFMVDTGFVSSIPALFTDAAAKTHPLLELYKSRINVSNQQLKYINTLKYPTVSLFGVFQTRASGFSTNYSVDQTAYSHNYFDGIKPTRSNYLMGIGITWNITSLATVKQQVKAQSFVSKALQEEFETVNLQLKAQQALAETKISNALANYNEAPVQVKAASDAFLQKSVLYRNGLTTIIDVTQALYLLNRAETNRDIAYSNVWQSLLLKAAASGDFNMFLNQVR